jgi:hypothetical protein
LGFTAFNPTYEHKTLGGVTMKSIFASLICWLAIVHLGFAAPERVPPDVFKTQRDGYLYADYPGVFDDAENEGITIEAWIYLTERPQDGDYRVTSEGRWIVLAKPGSYHVAITGRDLGYRNEGLLEGFTWIEFGIEQATENSLSTQITGRGIEPDDFPLRRWVHIAHQIVVKQDGTYNIPFYDRKNTSGHHRRSMGRADAPLMIGGPKPVTLNDRWEWDKRFESMKGYIDEVRISKGAVYGDKIGGKIRPPRRFRADRRTIALWHFREGPEATRYADSSGNGYTLRAGGSLAVEVRDKLATTWGSLKRRVLEGK